MWTKVMVFTMLVLADLGLDMFVSSDDNRGLACLESAGYTGAKLGDFAWMTCGGDSYAREFTAKNPLGKEVKGVVCAGLFVKACTVRF